MTDDDFRPLLDETRDRPIHSEVFGDVIYRGDRRNAETVVMLGELLAVEDEDS